MKLDLVNPLHWGAWMRGKLTPFFLNHFSMDEPQSASEKLSPRQRKPAKTTKKTQRPALVYTIQPLDGFRPFIRNRTVVITTRKDNEKTRQRKDENTFNGTTSTFTVGVVDAAFSVVSGTMLLPKVNGCLPGSPTPAKQPKAPKLPPRQREDPPKQLQSPPKSRKDPPKTTQGRSKSTPSHAKRMQNLQGALERC
jgi:hypothetical protein